MTEAVPLTHTSVGERAADAVALTDAIVDDPVTMINAFTVPAGERALFLTRWKDNAAAMARQPGFIQARMYEALEDEALLGFVNIVRWGSGAALAEARKQPEWRAAVQRMMDDDDLHITARPMVYRTALVVDPGGEP